MLFVGPRCFFFSLEDDGSLEVVGAVAATSTSNLEAVKFQASKLGGKRWIFFVFSVIDFSIWGGSITS